MLILKFFLSIYIINTIWKKIVESAKLELENLIKQCR